MFEVEIEIGKERKRPKPKLQVVPAQPKPRGPTRCTLPSAAQVSRGPSPAQLSPSLPALGPLPRGPTLSLTRSPARARRPARARSHPPATRPHRSAPPSPPFLSSSPRRGTLLRSARNARRPRHAPPRRGPSDRREPTCRTPLSTPRACIPDSAQSRVDFGSRTDPIKCATAAP